MDAREPLVSASGFREYDARWLYPTEINLAGIRAVGLAFGTLFQERGAGRDVITGHDFRSYSEEVHDALNSGLVAAGCVVHDIGLALTPMAYFAQFALDVPAVAMVTASHNENGWTGVKMGFERPFTLENEDMAALKQLVKGAGGTEHPGGASRTVSGTKERYLADLVGGRKISNELKVVVACGNGTAGAFAPTVFSDIGCQVVPLHCELDHSFPHYNPNPENLSMLKSLGEAVLASGADIGLAFDGDGDRCGAVDHHGKYIFADKIGVLLARAISSKREHAKYVVDVKSTALFQSDPVLKKNGAVTEYWKTGHSYLKRRIAETGATAAFERSGHFFFRSPYGRGYDDGLLSGIAICRMVDEAGESLSDLYDDLPPTWASPTMAGHCPDQIKYEVVGRLSRYFEDLRAEGKRFAGREIIGCLKVNGIRVEFEDESWVLARASSNKPEIVIVCESLASEAAMQETITEVENLFAGFPEIGSLRQTI